MRFLPTCSTACEEAADGRGFSCLHPRPSSSRSASWSLASAEPHTDGSVLLLKLFNDFSLELCFSERPAHHVGSRSSATSESPKQYRSTGNGGSEFLMLGRWSCINADALHSHPMTSGSCMLIYIFYKSRQAKHRPYVSKAFTAESQGFA